MTAPGRRRYPGGRWSGSVPAVLLGLTVVTRLPFLFPSVIDWDESTFILIGQSWADGHLPFTQLWDLKGPLTFAPFALAAWLFDRSIVAVRLIGALIVLLTGYAVYHLFLRLFGPAGSLAGAAFTILAVTAAPAGGAVMSETIAILPLTLAAIAVAEGDRRPWPGFAAGVLVSLAVLVRPNLGLCALALGLFGLWFGRKARLPARLGWAAAYLAGGVTPVLILVALYARAGAAHLIVEVLASSLAYAGSNLTPAEVSGTLVDKIGERLIEPNHLAYLLLAGALLLAFGRLAWCWRRLDRRQRELVLLNATLISSIAASILIGGQAWLHYLIQFLPFACPLLGILLAPELTPFAWRPRIALLATLGILLIAATPVAAAHLGLIGKLSRHGTPFADPGYQTARYLEQRLRPDDRVLFLTHHVAGWLIGHPPIDRIVHPSNLARDEHVSVPGKLRSILESRPRFVVFSERRRVLAQEPRIRSALDPVLARDYRAVARFDDVVLFERQGGRGGDGRP